MNWPKNSYTTLWSFFSESKGMTNQPFIKANYPHHEGKSSSTRKFATIMTIQHVLLCILTISLLLQEFGVRLLPVFYETTMLMFLIY